MLSYLVQKLIQKFIFFPDSQYSLSPHYFGLEYEDVYVTTEDNLRIHGCYFPGEKRETVLFFHGNAGNISDRLDNVNRLVKTGFSVFIIDYRGYGKSAGTPSVEGTLKDAQAAWDWLVRKKQTPADDIVVFGRSLGGAVAISLCAHETPKRVIVESTFTSVRQLACELYPFIPLLLIHIPNFYPSIDLIQHLSSPVLIIHGTKDSLIPFSHGRKLFEAAPEPKFFYPIDGGDHNDTYLVAGDDYFQCFSNFVASGEMHA